MKIIYLMFLIGLVMSPVAEAKDEIMSERAQELMSKLKVEEFSKKELGDRRKGVLSKQKFKKTGNLVVTHKAESGNVEGASKLHLKFSDHKGKGKAFGYLEYTRSARAAQVALFERLVMNSMPLEMIFERYEVKKDGPGDLCLVAKKLDRSKGRRVIDESKMMFIRGNVVISISARDASVNAEELATIMDDKLKDK